MKFQSSFSKFCVKKKIMQKYAKDITNDSVFPDK